MHRFFVAPPTDGLARITGEDVRHIRKALRLSVGETLALCDGNGRVCTAEIVEIADDAVTCRCGEWTRSLAEPDCAVTLFQGLPKTGKMETIIQKCVELGVSQVVPTYMARCVVTPDREYGKKLTRYRRVALEAAKQSGRGRVPVVGELCALGDIDLSGFDAAFVAYEEERTVSFKQALFSCKAHSVALIIGPECGFAPEEVDSLAEKGAIRVTLGTRILRTETAGMAMLAQLMYEVEP